MTLSWYIIKGDKTKPANRCRKWRVVVRKKDGTTRSSTFEGTKTDARKWAPDFAAEVEAEEGRATGGLTLGAYMDSWNDARLAAGEIAPNTHENFAKARKMYAAVSALPLREVDAAAIDADTMRLLRGRKRSTVRSYHDSLRIALEHAVKVGLIPSNPALASTAPKPERTERRWASEDAVSAILALSEVDYREFCVSMLLRTGMRLGELLGASWGDFTGTAIHVRPQSTKTESGARTIPLDAASAAYVESRRAYLEGIHGPLDQTLPLCVREDLEPPVRVTVQLWWSRNRARFGCEGVRLHDLRHTYLTNLAQAGVHPSVMQRLAGHATPAVSLAVYTHVRDADMAAAVSAMASMRGDFAKNDAKRM